MGRSRDEVLRVYRKKIQAVPYSFCHYKKFDYDILKYIPYLTTAGRGERISYNDVLIMADTETSKKSLIYIIPTVKAVSTKLSKIMLLHGL